MIKIIFRALIFSLLLLTSCNNINLNTNTNNNLNKSILNYSIIKYIDNNIEKAININKLISYVKINIGEDKLVSLSILEYEIKKQINWEKLSPEDSFLLTELFNYLHDYLSQYKEYNYIYIQEILDSILKITNDYILFYNRSIN